MELAERLRMWRFVCGLSVVDVARMAGVEVASVMRAEEGEANDRIAAWLDGEGAP